MLGTGPLCEPKKLWGGEGLMNVSLPPELSSPYQPTNISRSSNPTDDDSSYQVPLPAPGLLCFLELTRVLEEREGADRVGFWFSFSAHCEPAMWLA